MDRRDLGDGQREVGHHPSSFPRGTSQTPSAPSLSFVPIDSCFKKMQQLPPSLDRRYLNGI